MQDKNVIKLTDQDAALLEQGASMLEGLENDERNRGNCSTAEGAGCSAHAVRRLASALLAHEREIGQCLHQITEPQAAPAAVAVPGAAIAGALFDFCGYLTTLPLQQAITASEAHEACPMVEALEQWAAKRNLQLDDADVQGWRAALAATPAAVPAVPKWIDDPHDIEQGQMLNPEWVRQQQPAIMPKGESAAAQLRAMATNYPTGHSWDKLDAKACIRGALEIEALRALLAQAATAAAPAPPAEGVQAVEQGEVLVTVSGFTGSGKSAIAGEIEILCRALGLQVEWPDGAPEKNLTHADWTEALELYKPRVRIVECNVPHPFVKGQDK